jgi:hypothetical protein
MNLGLSLEFMARHRLSLMLAGVGKHLQREVMTIHQSSHVDFDDVVCNIKYI